MILIMNLLSRPTNLKVELKQLQLRIFHILQKLLVSNSELLVNHIRIISLHLHSCAYFFAAPIPSMTTYYLIQNFVGTVGKVFVKPILENYGNIIVQSYDQFLVHPKTLLSLLIINALNLSRREQNLHSAEFYNNRQEIIFF